MNSGMIFPLQRLSGRVMDLALHLNSAFEMAKSRTKLTESNLLGIEYKDESSLTAIWNGYLLCSKRDPLLLTIKKKKTGKDAKPIKQAQRGSSTHGKDRERSAEASQHRLYFFR